ncbi:MAG TPA: 8-amino-7-oxononanoate synthase [Verrucomicrobiota bacterium]|jgi:8-amino-7-oxononanoate synthase|nr:8-amino-7-oxononanoate synthase [Verrucomicrobiota bacterium]HQL78781.1 8-amino-7-oxononanoate synthase [Verrucomicrobiota bacterium]
MMNDFEAEMARRLAALHEGGLWRELRRVDSPQSPRIKIGGKALLNFSSNDYLGLANEPALREGAIRAVERYGAGAGASRLICGSLAPHCALDESLATFKGVEAALSFSTGYAAAIGAICALLGKEDFIILDKLVHACIVDAARLCGAKLRVFGHNDLEDLEAKLKWASTQAPPRKARGLVVTESVFSMDGDHAPLREIVALKERYGAWLMVDEAHAAGLYGIHRRGLAEELGVSDRIEVQMGTLGKAMGAAGGYICGSRALVDYLVNRARTFIFSTAPVPAAAAAAAAGVRVVQSSAGEERRNKLWQNVARLRPASNGLASTGRSAIIPIRIGDEAKAVAAAAALREQGIFIPAIRYPTVARGAARLRLTVTAAHTQADLDQLRAALRSLDVRL